MKKIARYIPLVFLLIVMVANGLLLAQGGMTRVMGWYLVQFVVPIIGGLILLISGGIAVLRWRRPDQLTIVILILSYKSQLTI